MARFRLLAASSLVVLALSACGSAASQPPAGSPTPVPSGTVAVEASEYKFDSSTISVTAGETTFTVKNVGQVEHEFEIFKGDQVVDEIEGLVPGLTKSITVNLEAGDYTFLCKLSGHEEQGMKGTLTVGER